ncbi:MAG: type IV secretion system protein VirB10 [Phyllobacterium sp.]
MPDPDYHRNAEIENATQSQLLEPRRGLSTQALVVLFAVLAVPLLAMPFWLGRPVAPDNAGNGADDNLLPPAGPVQLALPPAPPPPPAEPTASNPVQSSAEAAEAAERARQIAELEEARRQAETERRARESDEEQKKWERYRSPMVVTETGQSAELPAEAAKPPAEAEKSAGTFQETNPNGQLLSALSAKSVEVAKAEKTKRIDALVPQGTMIRGVLETAVQTDLPGMVRAVTTEDVWSFDGRRVLIPAGSRVTGEYNAGVAQGQTRAYIVWTRLLRSDGVSLNLGSPGTDELGISGSGGKVDNHYVKRFGSAILLTALTGGAQLLAEPGIEVRRRRDTGPITTVTTDPATGKTTSTTVYPDDAQDMGADLGTKGAALAAQSFAQVAQEALKGTVNIQPTITINQGTPVSIFVRRDLDFSDLYPDPVMQKLKELKQGRYGDGE